jgi:hypothetical protein
MERLQSKDNLASAMR